MSFRAATQQPPMFESAKQWFQPSPAFDDAGNRIPFTPRGRKQPYFFLHIPKTSGSSWNAVLQEVYGKRNFVAHAEYHLGQLLTGDQPRQLCDGVSAHIPYNRWHRLPGVQPYQVLTVLRDPWARLVSHINWMDRFNHGKSLQGHGRQSTKISYIAKLIERTDFESRESLNAFLDGLTGDGFYPAFNNMQVRMLFAGQGAQMKMDVDSTVVEAAVQTLASIAGFGFCEDQDAFQADVLKTLGQPSATTTVPHKNKGPVRRVHTSLTLAQEVLAPLYEHDNAVYAQAKRLTDERLNAHGSRVMLRSAL